MSENTPDFQDESQNLLLFIWRKRKIIIIISAIAFVASIVISLFLTPLYKSTAIVFPTATSTVSFSEQRNAKASSMDFGEEEQAEQLLQILQSSRIRNRIVERFDLFNHYEIDPNDENRYFKLGQEYKMNKSYYQETYWNHMDPFRERLQGLVDEYVIGERRKPVANIWLWLCLATLATFIITLRFKGF